MACLGAATACGTDGRDGPADPLLGALAEAVEERPFPARLSVDLPWTACAPDALRCAPLPRPGSRAFQALADVSQRIGASAPAGPAGDHLRGLTELLWVDEGTARALDRAVALLGQAAEGRPSAQALSDLSAALLVRAASGGAPFDLIRSLDAAGRALALDGAHAPALHNQALALDRLSLPEEAAPHWERAAAATSSGPWREEARAGAARAREQAAALATPPADPVLAAVAAGDSAALARAAREDPQAAREVALEQLLPVWASGGEPALGALRAARILGRELRDGSVAATVEARLPPALLRWDEAGRARARGDDEAAVRAYLAVADLLPADAPLGLLALAEAGSLHFLALRYDPAEGLFDRVLLRADRGSFPAVVGRALWGRAIVASRRGSPSEALDGFLDAAGLYQTAGEWTNAGFLNAMAAEMLKQLGRPEEAWAHRFRALELLTRGREPGRLQSALWEAADAALRLRAPWAALTLQEAGLGVARRTGRPSVVAEALYRRGRVLAELGRRDDAQRDLDEARETAEGLPPSGNREIHLAGIRWTAATLALDTAPEHAVSLLDPVVDFHASSGYRLELAAALRLRGDAALRAGRDGEGMDDLARSVQVVEALGSTVSTPLDAASFSAAAQAAFDVLAAHRALELDDPSAALDLVEQGRRLSLGLAGVGETPRGVAARARRELPTDLVVLEYAVLRDRVALWVLGSGSEEHRLLDVSADSLRTLAEAFLAATASGEEARVRSLGSRLFTLLFPGELPSRLEGKRVVVSPEEFLAGLPWAALVDPRSGRWAVELWPTAVTPFTHFLLDGLAEAALRPRSADPSVLLVGEPAVEEERLPGLPPLPGAAQEVEELATLYPGARVLAGSQATAPRVRDALRGREILHYAGHAVYDPDLPEASRLVLAPSGSGPADFAYTRDLGDWPLRGLRLVVLSACSSVTPTRSPVGGLWGLAHPFLAEGAATVLGSLWDVDDAGTRPLVLGFHAAWREGLDAGAALRQAQLALLRAPDGRFASPRYWAAAQVLGSVP